MKTARTHDDSRRVDLYPQTRICPECHESLIEKYHKQRWIVQLNEQLQVVSHCLGCETPNCSQNEAVYRPEAENHLALKGYTFGLDVIAYIGESRYRQNKTIVAIQEQLSNQLSISIKEVALLCEVFLALVTTVAQQDRDLIQQLQQLGGIVLSIDGIQPEKGNETLYLLREVRLGRVLVARNLLSSATREIELLIENVKQLGVPIVGVISDKQDTICRAVERQLPGVAHQLCHYHYLKNLAQPVCEADRQLKKALKQKIRQIRPVEVAAKQLGATLEGGIVKDYCLALRTVMGQQGKYPLDASGVRLYEKLREISDSIHTLVSIRPSVLMQRLQRRLSLLPSYQATATKLNQAFGWIRQIAHRLNAEGSAQQAAQDLLTYLGQLKLSAPDSLKEWVEHFEKITHSFASKLFSYLAQPLLPLTNNELEIFIGQLKKRRRQVTGRKNTQAFILREGAAVAILFSLPRASDWLTSFPQVKLDDFRSSLAAIRRSAERSKCWQIRHDLQTYLSQLEQHWLTG